MKYEKEDKIIKDSLNVLNKLKKNGYFDEKTWDKIKFKLLDYLDEIPNCIQDEKYRGKKKVSFIVIAEDRKGDNKQRLSDEILNENYYENIEINLSALLGYSRGDKIKVILEKVPEINLMVTKHEDGNKRS
jgi:hypothetical protein